MIAYTDYPFVELGDEAGRPAPIRKINVICWDGVPDKYVWIEVFGIRRSIKYGYIYQRPGRYKGKYWLEAEVACAHKTAPLLARHTIAIKENPDAYL